MLWTSVCIGRTSARPKGFQELLLKFANQIQSFIETTRYCSVRVTKFRMYAAKDNFIYMSMHKIYGANLPCKAKCCKYDFIMDEKWMLYFRAPDRQVKWITVWAASSFVSLEARQILGTDATCTEQYSTEAPCRSFDGTDMQAACSKINCNFTLMKREESAEAEPSEVCRSSASDSKWCQKDM